MAAISERSATRATAPPIRSASSAGRWW